MKTILRVRGPGEPEAEPEVVLESWLDMDGGNVRWRIKALGCPDEFTLARLSVRNGLSRLPFLSDSLGLPLDNIRRLVDCTEDEKSEVFKELVAACKEVRADSSLTTRALRMLNAAIAKADELTQEKEAIE